MPELKFVGGHPCLDFVNTVGGRDPRDAVLRDKLTDFQTLLLFSRQSGLFSAREMRRVQYAAERHPRKAARALAGAVRLRESLYRILKSLLGGNNLPIAAVEVFSNYFSTAWKHQRLIVSGSRFVWKWDDSKDALDSPLWRLSQAAADLLTSPELSRLRQCGGEECGWLFLDTSRNRKRRWCDMKDCGNRAKVRRFRRRHDS